jgi:lysophospholipase L1-like esterase
MIRNLWIAAAILLLAGPAAGDEPVRLRVVLCGDSTVATNSGWGDAFGKLLAPSAECLNSARSGRSSKSYRDEGHWTKALAQKPAFVLIQFGHNDQPGKGPERETDPATTFRDNLRRYIAEARESGAAPILVTPLSRRIFGDDGKIKSTLTPYAEAAIAVAAEQKVPLVDLHARSIEQLNQLGPAGSTEFNPTTKDGSTDRTHLNEKGAATTAKLVADELRKVAPEVAKHLK